MNKIVRQPFDFGTIDASGSKTSESIDLASYANIWKFSLQLVVTGDGTATISMLCSNDGINYTAPDSPNIVVNFSKTSGPGADGKSMVIAFDPPFCKYLKLKATETGGANTVTPNAEVCIQ